MDWRTRLLHPKPAPEGFQSLAPAVHRASTTVLPDVPGSPNATWDHPYSYGLYGTPTVLDLGQRLADLCGGAYTFIAPSGQSAIALVDLATLHSGDHVLIPTNVYGTSADIARQMLTPLGIDVAFYDPMGPLTPHLKPSTRLIWFEAPGSITMEVPDLTAQLAEVHAFDTAHKIITAIDDTYSAGVLLRPFDLGFDISVQALTKYIGGHSDLLLGSVTLRPSKKATHDLTDQSTWDKALTALYTAVGNTRRILGLNTSPDDAALALRGIETLGVRLAAVETSALEIAHWCAQHPKVERVLHPALPSCPGHTHFARLFTGSSSIFSIVLKAPADAHSVAASVARMQLFKLGYSWGGTTSVVMAYPEPGRITEAYGERLIRLGVGLEDPKDLIADLEQAIA